MSTHNITFHREISKICGYPLLSVTMTIYHIYSYKCPCSNACAWFSTHKKGPNAICKQHRSRSACASMQSDLSILCSSTYTTVSIDSVSGQWTCRLIRDCVVHKLHTGPFPALHIICYIWTVSASDMNAKPIHCSLETPKMVIGKQWRPWSATTDCGIWSVSLYCL